MKKQWLIIVAGLTLALAAITGCGGAPAGNRGDSDHQDVPEDWKLVEASGGQGGFSVRLPQEWQLNQLQGVDSYVGEIIGGGGRLTFDFGWYSSSLVDDDDPQHIVTYEEIGGRRAKLVRPGAEGDGLITGVYFEDFDGGDVDGPPQNRLQISGAGLTPDQQKIALAVFRSVRLLDSDDAVLEPSGEQRPVTSIDDIDPNECNRIHNITACDDTGSGSVESDGMPGPGIAVGEPFPLPTADKSCGPMATVAITSDGQVECFDPYDTGTANGSTGGQVVGPQPPMVEPRSPVTVRSDEGIDPNECNWIHNINACFSDGQAPTDIPMDEYMAVLWLARQDLSHRLGVEIGSIKLGEIERAGWPVYWPEEPKPGVAYIDIARAGFRMVLEADGQTYRYETDTSERVVFVG